MRFGTTIAEWEERVNVEKLRKDRLAKANYQLKEKGLGAVLCYDFDNIRYITGTIAGEWARNKMTRYCILVEGQDPIIYDPAAPTKRRDCPWIDADKIRPALGSMRGAIPLEVNNIQVSPRALRALFLPQS